MKHVRIYENNVTLNDSYNKHLNEAVFALNTSATAKRDESEATHADERSSIIEAITTSFPDRTIETVVVDLINHPRINSRAVWDYMYFHHPTFPGNKACIAPSVMPDALKLGLHIVRRMKSNLFTDDGLDIKQNTLIPVTDLGYFNAEKKQWVYFRINDTDLYQTTSHFKDQCIINALPFVGSGPRTDFHLATNYITAYRELNHTCIPTIKQYDFIGWNEEKTYFVNPRSTDTVIATSDVSFQGIVRKGYVAKGNEPAKNVNDILTHLKDFPLAVATYITSFINVIIDGDIVQANCMVLDIFGQKGKGKNLLQHVAMNPIGSSVEGSALLQTWVNTSNAGGLSMIKPHSSHPVFMTESHTAGGDMLRDIIYMIFESAIGGKSNLDGTRRADGSLSSFLISSGEDSILYRTKVDGASRRVVPLPIEKVLEPIINQPTELVNWHKRIGGLLSESYGIALDPFIEYSLKNKEKITALFEHYREKYKSHGNGKLFDNEKYTSFSKFLSCVHLVLDCLLELYGLTCINSDDIEMICNSIDSYLKSLCITCHKYVEALDYILSFASKNEKKHFVNGNPNHPQWGYYSTEIIDDKQEPCLIFETSELKEQLTQAGYLAPNTLSSWKSADVIHSINNKASMRKGLRRGGDRPYCTVILLNKARKLVDEMNEYSDDKNEIEKELHDTKIKSNVVPLQF